MPKKRSNKPTKQTAAKSIPAAETIVPATAAATPVPVIPASAVSLPAALPQPVDFKTAAASYQDLYDALGRAYWEASDIHSKDTIQGARDAVYSIITDLNTAKLEANTAAYLALKDKVTHANKTLGQIKNDINSITKNITTAANVISVITRVLNIATMF